MSNKETNLIWLDLEMTGLNVEKEVILEIATVVTDANLTILATGPDLVIAQDKIKLQNMGTWCQTHHGASGLTKAVEESEVSTEDAEEATINFLKKYVTPGKSPMCGNSIGMDRKFLEKYMPQLANFFHYRNIDVSSIKELVKRWCPDLIMAQKHSNHRAMDDIKDSIDELKHYREYLFRY